MRQSGVLYIIHADIDGHIGGEVICKLESVLHYRGLALP